MIDSKRKYGVVFILLILQTACLNQENSIKNRLNGQWAIDIVKYDDRDYSENLLSNVLIFKVNGVISIPESYHFPKDRSSRWNLKQIGDSIEVHIKSSNTVFSGSFSVEYVKDEEKKLRGIVLKSDRSYIRAYKLLQNYDRW